MQRSVSRLSPLIFAAVLTCLLSLSHVSASAAKDASIRLPEELAADARRIEFEGFGGFNRGTYAGDEYRGEFTRIESRLGVFDPLYVANRGKSGFTVEGISELDGLDANCRAAQSVATVRIVTLDLEKLTYECEFGSTATTDGWRFVLGEPKREGFREKLIARDRRRGEASILDVEMLIESVHEYSGSRFTSQAPLGYLVESDGIVIAAIDLLDWNPVVHLREDLTVTTARAAVVVALALAVLRDPANSALED